MSAKLIVLEDAAAMLGMTPEELTELRSNNEIFGYRDGKTWKFKQGEIERFANQREIEMRANPGDSVKIGGGESLGEPVDIDADLDELVDVGEINLDEPLLETPESAMVTDDDESGGSSSSSSTIIGKSAIPDDLGTDLLGALDDEPAGESETSVGLPTSDEVDSIEIVDSDDSEIKIAEESGLTLDTDLGGSDLKLAAGSDVSIEADEPAPTEEPDELQVSGSSSELNLAASDSEITLAPSDSEINIAEGDDDIVLGDDDGADEIDLTESLDMSDDDLEISLDSSSEIDLDGLSGDLEGAETGVGLMGSDITLNAGESGINLATPTDSGISLEQTPGEISIEDDEVLELGEASEIDFEDAGGGALVEDAEGLEADDEFLLTPVAGDALEESDSGSQVIALDTEELEEGEATMLEAVDDDDEEEELVALPGEVSPEAAAMPAAPGLAAAPEGGYSLPVVLLLCTVALPLALGGFMMLDLVRHMWTWDEPYTINSSLMDFILSIFGSSR